jgi:hypothetical protein
MKAQVNKSKGLGRTSSKMRKHALLYAKAGWRVFPIAAGQKQPPLLKSWQKQASSDRRVVKAWWIKWPDANIGCLTGSTVGFFVIDVDRHKEKNGRRTFAALVEQHGEPNAALVSKTPNKGLHYFYATSEPVRSGVDVLGIGIDVRGEGGYVVLPPSRTARGAYAWSE